MPIVVRFVGGKEKWRAHAEYESERDFDYRAIRDLLPREKTDSRPAEGRPSVFYARDEAEIKILACAWSIARDDFDRVDLVHLDEAGFSENKIELARTAGNTGIQLLDEAHAELELRRGLPISEVISAIVWKKYVVRVGKEDLAPGIRELIATGRLAQARMSAKIAAEIEAYEKRRDEKRGKQKVARSQVAARNEGAIAQPAQDSICAQAVVARVDDSLSLDSVGQPLMVEGGGPAVRAPRFVFKAACLALLSIAFVIVLILVLWMGY